MHRDRNWTVLFVGGASGTGKSSAAYALGRYYGVNVLEVDDVYQAIKAVTSAEAMPAVHQWSAGANWMDVGIQGNVDWLRRVSREIAPGLRSIVEGHIETQVPVIIEGDFLDPALIRSFDPAQVQGLVIHEPDRDQLLQNYLRREGGEPQHYRADISVAYGNWLADTCEELGIAVFAARPWNTLLERIASHLS